MREAARLRGRLNACYRALARPGGSRTAHWMEQARQLEAALLEAGRRQALAGATASAGGAPPMLDLPALHAALGGHSALVEYFSIDDALHVCVAAGGRIQAQRLPCTLAQVQAAVEQLRFQTDTLRRGAARLAHRLPELQQRALHHLQALHAMLWAPLLPALDERRAIVVPHGALHYLPFEALHDGQQHEIARREICRAPSAALLLRGLAPPTARWQTALVLGHADERLPQVGAEVDAVAACFGQGQALQGPAATGQALRHASTADVLHIACHAQFRNDSPRFSALHLADGAFTVRDVAQLRLARGLVTLSACETAISAVLPGDELIGLTHAFLSAGASRVLASLWTVQDDTTAAFMPRFYQRLRAGRPTAQALRLTQLETLAQQPHPYFWAAFTLHGGW
jgi:CHAT domain-containing protein